jgi:hypothetical protein
MSVSIQWSGMKLLKPLAQSQVTNTASDSLKKKSCKTLANSRPCIDIQTLDCGLLCCRSRKHCTFGGVCEGSWAHSLAELWSSPQYARVREIREVLWGTCLDCRQELYSSHKILGVNLKPVYAFHAVSLPTDSSCAGGVLTGVGATSQVLGFLFVNDHPLWGHWKLG